MDSHAKALSGLFRPYPKMTDVNLLSAVGFSSSQTKHITPAVQELYHHMSSGFMVYLSTSPMSSTKPNAFYTLSLMQRGELELRRDRCSGRGDGFEDKMT